MSDTVTITSQTAPSVLLSRALQPTHVDRSLTELRAMWSDFAPTYAAHLERSHVSLSQTLVQALQLDRPGAGTQRILEVGAGSGLAAVELAAHLHMTGSPSSYVVSDVCPGSSVS